jgi:hypothetical protein
MRTSLAQYLGDGVYVDMERGMVRLTTENGQTTTNTIYLEPDVLHSLLEWLKYAGLAHPEETP